MRRAATAFVVAAVLAAGSTTGMTALAPSRDLWVGVLQHSVLVPAAALVSGRWWYEKNDGGESTSRLSERVGQLPARWLPPGRVPASWRAYLFNGRTAWLRIVGALFRRDFAGDTFAVNTDLKTGSLSAEGWEAEAVGVAIAGTAAVHQFKPAPAQVQAELLPFVESAVIEAEGRAIKAYLAAPDDSGPAKLLARAADPLPGTAHLQEPHTVQSRARDGATLYFIDGGNMITKADMPGIACELRVNVTVRKDPSGALTVVGAFAQAWCDELDIDFNPLAIVERDGESCWLMELVFEDGVEYRLTRPGHAVYEANASECGLK